MPDVARILPDVAVIPPVVTVRPPVVTVVAPRSWIESTTFAVRCTRSQVPNVPPASSRIRAVRISALTLKSQRRFPALASLSNSAIAGRFPDRVIRSLAGSIARIPPITVFSPSGLILSAAALVASALPWIVSSSIAICGLADSGNTVPILSGLLTSTRSTGSED